MIDKALSLLYKHPCMDVRVSSHQNMSACLLRTIYGRDTAQVHYTTLHKNTLYTVLLDIFGDP